MYLKLKNLIKRKVKMYAHYGGESFEMEFSKFALGKDD